MIGNIFVLISLATNRHFYFLYFYFFAFGIISFFVTGCKYASMTDSELNIFFGWFFNRKSIKLFWKDLSSIQKTTRQKNYILTYAGHGMFPAIWVGNVAAVEIVLKKTIPQDIVNIITEQKPGIELVNDGQSILLLHPPEGGFGEFINAINFYLNKQEKDKTVFSFRKLTFILDWMIIVFTVILILKSVSKYLSV